MLQHTTLKFLTALKKNNNRSWFEENRKVYENAKADFYALTGQLIPALAKYDKSIGHLAVKDCVFRINRDVRFSKDKSPYKNNMACYFNRAGKKSNGAGYYLHIEPGKSMIAGGLWMPESTALANIRQEIDYSFEDWKKLIGTTAFKKTFIEGVKSSDTLIRPPKGYDESNPAIEYLKMKSFVVTKQLSDKALLDKSAVNEIVKTFNIMKPFIDFLNTAIE